MPRFFAKFIMAETIVQFERDVPIWNNKTFLSNPGLVKEVPLLRTLLCSSRFILMMASRRHDPGRTHRQVPSLVCQEFLLGELGEGGSGASGQHRFYRLVVGGDRYGPPPPVERVLRDDDPPIYC